MVIFRQWFDNGFEVESKYQRKTVVLLLIAHILSLQDAVLRSMLFLIYQPLMIKLFYWSSKTKVVIVCDSFFRKPISIVHCLRKLGL